METREDIIQAVLQSLQGKTTQDVLNSIQDTLVIELNPVSYTHLDVYKRQIQGLILRSKLTGER